MVLGAYGLVRLGGKRIDAQDEQKREKKRLFSHMCTLVEWGRRPEDEAGIGAKPEMYHGV